VLAAALQLCEGKASERRVHLVQEGDPDLEAPINPPLLEQAVVNLVDNAIKYTAEGGRVTVSTRPEEGDLVIEVSDNGCGIPPEHQPRIFERFYRVDRARSRSLGGTGLGLAIVKHITAAHHGLVSVESLPGQGSTFRIRIPSGGEDSSPSLPTGD
jgi:two-component system phosphate regulon sensor histidine kinase PhoR